MYIHKNVLELFSSSRHTMHKRLDMSNKAHDFPQRQRVLQSRQTPVPAQQVITQPYGTILPYCFPAITTLKDRFYLYMPSLLYLSQRSRDLVATTYHCGGPAMLTRIAMTMMDGRSPSRGIPPSLKYMVLGMNLVGTCPALMMAWNNLLTIRKHIAVKHIASNGYLTEPT
jgi:hypothetical protein